MDSVSPSRIPISVAILTHNSADTLPRALESVSDFAQIIVCDGNSTDGTRVLAVRSGALVIDQDPSFLDSLGRIIDFAGIRNQTLAAATYDWFLYLDSDEELSPELRDEIRLLVQGPPQAYLVLRKYVWNEQVIDCSIAYPNYQLRLFHRDVAEIFIKPIHERIKLKEGIVPAKTSSFTRVPLSTKASELKDRWRRYITLEVARRPPLSITEWLRICAQEGAVALLYCMRLVRTRLFCSGNKLPLSFEWARIQYQLDLIKALRRTIRKKTT